MEIKLLLNFPKIRQITQSVDLVLDSIKHTLKANPQCNFEIDPEETRIRKRVVQKNSSV
jgi:hypothetical protein